MLNHNAITLKDKKCLILGNGGTSHTIHAVLKHLGASEIFIISRQATDTTISYEQCYQSHMDAEVIINTTPLGMYPKIDAAPLDLTFFTKCTAVVDAIYNPLQTKLTLQAQELGIKGITGLEMLVAQAKQAKEYFLDTAIDDRKIEETYQKLLKLI
jgi:shikimate dehydrogenase